VRNTDFTLNGLGLVSDNTKLKVNDGGVLRTDGGGHLEVHSTLVIEGGTVEVDVDLWGHLNWTSAASLTGNLVTHPGSRIEVEDPIGVADLVIANGFDVHGSLFFNDTIAQSLTVVSGNLTIAGEGTLSTHAGLGVATTVPVLDATLVNEGLVEIDSLDLRIAHPGAQHENTATGTIEVASADLEIDLGDLTEVVSNFTNHGTIIVGGGGTIRIVGSAGVLDVPSNFTNHGTVTVAGGGTVRVIGTPGGGSPISFIDTGDLDLDSGGAVIINGANFAATSTGRVGGFGLLDLTAAEAVGFDGSLLPGWSEIGVFTIAGDLELSPIAEVAVQIAGDESGTEHDRLDVTGNLTAGGTFDVTLVDPYQPSGGELFQLLTFGGLTDWFDVVSLPPLLHLLTWNLTVGATNFTLGVVCLGTQLTITMTADRDPVSLGHELVYQVAILNSSSVDATDLVLSDPLPAGLIFRSDLSSPSCTLVGDTVECTQAVLGQLSSWEVAIGVDTALTGPLDNTAMVASWECDTYGLDNTATATVQVVAAEPCDANYDLAINSDDVAPAVSHLFGQPAPGNPDCRPGNGITADDIAAIIDASQ